MTQLIALLFALVGSDEQLEALLEQQAAGDVGAEVTASSAKCVGTAAVWGFGVTPQYIYNLSRDADGGGQLSAGQDWFLFVGSENLFFLQCLTSTFPNLDNELYANVDLILLGRILSAA